MGGKSAATSPGPTSSKTEDTFLAGMCTEHKYIPHTDTAGRSQTYGATQTQAAPKASSCSPLCLDSMEVH